MKQLLTVEEIEQLLKQKDWSELNKRFMEHLDACGESLPAVLASLTPDERDQLVKFLLRLAGDNSVIH
jgi:hypothetical protein